MNSFFSIIIPVLHESTLINQTIDRVTCISSAFDSEIIVVDADPKGGTLERITYPNIVRKVSGRGRGRQMNAGAGSAKGDILVFLHADTELPEDALRSIASVMEDKRCCGGAFDLGIKSGRLAFRLIENLVFLRTRLTSVPYGDQAIFVRKDCFEALGGFGEIPIMEDIEFMLRMKKSGRPIFIIPQKVNTSPRRWEREGILRCTLRNWILTGLYLMGVKPERLVRFYYRDWDQR